MDWQIASPNPMPLDLVVKNASKMRSMSFGSIPVPVSSMDTAIAFESITIDVTFSTRGRSVTFAIGLAANACGLRVRGTRADILLLLLGEHERCLRPT